MKQRIQEAVTAAPAAVPPALLKARLRHKLIAAFVFAGILIMTDGFWMEVPLVHETFEQLGYIAVAICVLGRAWCSAYIGGRKKTSLVTSGPYSIVRNPLYVFSFIGVVGLGLYSGIVTFLVGLPLLYAVYCYRVVRSEEAFLTHRFGDLYRAYATRVPRWLPNPRLWRDDAEIVVRPHFLAVTLRDAAVLFLAMPLLDLVETLHEAGLLPVLFRLP